MIEKILDSDTPKSTTDLVFDHLYEEIVNLEILPGSKMSEVEVSKRFGVSRQPVRDAFKRLGSLELLEIRPQRATAVRLFSIREIENTRFLRLAVELELIELACANWNTDNAQKMQANIAAQETAVAEGDPETLHRLDYEFHRLFCDVSGRPMAVDTIEACKRKVDRLCMLSLSHDEGGAAILADHKSIVDAISRGDVAESRALIRHHLNRLSDTITEIYETHTHYFV
ncbi:GntR family transcriptional regulator [Octadecabacter sp.]|nr:GntR family transcriptional regulator [Octadecabacter sp.]